MVCIAFPPVAAYGVNWGLLAVSPTGFITVDIYFVNGALQDESELGTMMDDMRSSQLRRFKDRLFRERMDVLLCTDIGRRVMCEAERIWIEEVEADALKRGESKGR